ncbi:hypothetical protein PUN28_006050 [Cardiocondyla obscurior]|uniref:Secreted protein n=1 Tax=Cardiocondyla obscurior TaxID=286306 RepID=A0AAW2G8N5_9HYME
MSVRIRLICVTVNAFRFSEVKLSKSSAIAGGTVSSSPIGSFLFIFSPISLLHRFFSLLKLSARCRNCRQCLSFSITPCSVFRYLLKIDIVTCWSDSDQKLTSTVNSR